jgi:hypothetical protein
MTTTNRDENGNNSILQVRIEGCKDFYKRVMNKN